MTDFIKNNALTSRFRKLLVDGSWFDRISVSALLVAIFALISAAIYFMILSPAFLGVISAWIFAVLVVFGFARLMSVE